LAEKKNEKNPKISARLRMKMLISAKTCLTFGWKGSKMSRDSNEAYRELIEPHLSSDRRLIVGEIGGISFNRWRHEA
jgi:hypothetical protein